MRSRRVTAAVLAALIVVALGSAVATTALHVTDSTRGPVHAVSGQLIEVSISFVGTDIVSKDAAIVAPLFTTNGSTRDHFFVAAFPGQTTLQPGPCAGRCLAPYVVWHVEVDVD